MDYAQYEVFTRKRIWYVTRLKDNALYQAREEFDIPDDADSGVLKDEQIELSMVRTRLKSIFAGALLTGIPPMDACSSSSPIIWNFRQK